MKIKPLFKRILVEPIEEAVTSKSGIILAGTVEKPLPIRGKVLAVGKEVTDQIKKGSLIIFDQYTPNKFKEEGVEYYIVHEEDVKALISE